MAAARRAAAGCAKTVTSAHRKDRTLRGVRHSAQALPEVRTRELRDIRQLRVDHAVTCEDIRSIDRVATRVPDGLAVAGPSVAETATPRPAAAPKGQNPRGGDVEI